MCFSAEASFISSAALTIGGIVTLKQVKKRNDLPFAVFPLIFAFHQFIEGCIWMLQANPGPPWLLTLLSHVFPIIAYSVWATLAPYSFLKMETHPIRRRLLTICLTVGVGVSLFFLFYILRGPVTAVIINDSIHYDFYFSFYILSQWCYGFSIILAALLSSHKIVTLFGLGMVVSYNIAKIFYLATYPSVFCFLAAILSLIIYIHVRYGDKIKSWHTTADSEDSRLLRSRA